MKADHLTAAGLAAAAGTAVAVGTGRLGLGLALLVVTALADLLDGPVAKASGTTGPRGAFFDSVADRVSDSLILGGIAWYLAGEDGGRAALLPLAVLATSNLISYERAKAESLGYSAKGGIMERAERIMVLMVALAFSALLVPALWVMLALTLVTVVHRFTGVWRQAGRPRPQRSPAPARARDERLWAGSALGQARWRAWRESAAARGTRSRRSGGWRPRSDERPRRRSRTRP